MGKILGRFQKFLRPDSVPATLISVGFENMFEDFRNITSIIMFFFGPAHIKTIQQKHRLNDLGLMNIHKEIEPDTVFNKFSGGNRSLELI